MASASGRDLSAAIKLEPALIEKPEDRRSDQSVVDIFAKFSPHEIAEPGDSGRTLHDRTKNRCFNLFDLFTIRGVEFF